MARPRPVRFTVLVVEGALLAVLTAACGGSGPSSPSPPPQSSTPTIPSGLSNTLTGMLQTLPDYIAQALSENQGNLPRNPHIHAEIQAKIAMLQSPSLAADILIGRRWSEVPVSSINGRSIPIAVVFPLENMREEATEAVRTLEPVLPILERFFDVPLPSTAIRIWYGFVIGNRGGGGVIYTEDRTTYEARTAADRLPYDAIWAHELGHSYILHESLD